MTWSRALPVLALCVVFDGLRLFFEGFVFFGPALAAAYCAIKASGVISTISFGLLGGKTAAVVCTGAAAVLGTAISAVTIPLGIVLAMAVGLLGWMTIGLLLIITNARIFKANFWNLIFFVGAFLVDETPLIGALPGLSVATWRMYNTQIKSERAELAKWEAQQQENLAAERQEQVTEAQAYLSAQASEDAALAEETGERNLQETYDDLGFGDLSDINDELALEREAGLYPDYEAAGPEREFA